jgi:addiction module HigA family antidote
MTARNPTHPAASLRDSLEAEGWSVNEFAARLGISRATASRLLNGRSGISPGVALALEHIGWSNADFWMRRQASYDLSVARRDRGARPALDALERGR